MNKELSTLAAGDIITYSKNDKDHKGTFVSSANTYPLTTYFVKDAKGFIDLVYAHSIKSINSL